MMQGAELLNFLACSSGDGFLLVVGMGVAGVVANCSASSVPDCSCKPRQNMAGVENESLVIVGGIKAVYLMSFESCCLCPKNGFTKSC